MSTDSLVADQYENWIYPEPVQQLEPFFTRGRFIIGDPAKYHDLYWPDKPYNEAINILIAGCGANEAAIYAYSNPNAHVVGIDLSQASLEHEQQLKTRYQLHNLDLKQLPIEQVAQLEQEFDLIISSGVLHHTDNPEYSLSQLKTVVRPDGVIRLMLYAKYGRTGVYQMQELFKLLELEQDQAGLDLVDVTLDALGDQHFVKSYIKNSGDLDYEGGRVDTFLHKRDRAYTVEDCLDLAKAAGLEFTGWLNNRPYYPEAVLNASHPLVTKLNLLPEEDIWKAMELFHGRISKHEFLLCRTDRAENNRRIDTSDESIRKLIPVMFPGKLSLANPAQQAYSIRYVPYPEIPPIGLTESQSRLALFIDGTNTVESCAELAGPGSNQIDIAVTFFRALWRLGLITFRTVPVR